MIDNNNFLMPGLRRIAYLKTADLPQNIRMMSDAKINPAVAAPATDINFFGSADLSYSKSKDGKKVSTLTFSSSDSIPLNDIAFIVENQSRQRFIIGALEAPFPKIELKSNTGGSPSDKRADVYSVTWAGCPTRIDACCFDDADKI